MTHWGMVVDLRNCIGCKTCVSSCSQANSIPDSFWRKAIDCGLLEKSSGKRFFLTMSCMQCEDAPCLKVCPTGATYRRHDNIVDIDNQRCVGCGYCIVACPYDARAILEKRHTFEACFYVDESKRRESELYRGGVCTKCNFCAPILDKGLANNCQPGRDREATPRCVMSCSSKALHFGDLDDPHSNVSRMLKSNKALPMQQELSTRPSVFYIIDPEWKDRADEQLKGN